MSVLGIHLPICNLCMQAVAVVLSASSVELCAAMQDLTSLSAYNTRVRRSAADRIHLAMPNLQKLRLGHGAALPAHN